LREVPPLNSPLATQAHRAPSAASEDDKWVLMRHAAAHSPAARDGRSRRDRTSRVAGGEYHGRTGRRRMRPRCKHRPRPAIARLFVMAGAFFAPTASERASWKGVRSAWSSRPFVLSDVAGGRRARRERIGIKDDAPGGDPTAIFKPRHESIRLKIAPGTAHALTRGL